MLEQGWVARAATTAAVVGAVMGGAGSAAAWAQAPDMLAPGVTATNAPPSGWVDRATLTLTATASDADGGPQQEVSGIHRVELTEPLVPGAPVTQPKVWRSLSPGTSTPCEGTVLLPCPVSDPGVSFTINTRYYAEGPVDATLEAVDAAGNRSPAVPWRGAGGAQPKVDHTPPQQVTGVSVSHDAAARTARVSWAPSSDPLASGAPGSGVTGYRVQYLINDEWWEDGGVVTDPWLDLTNIDPDDQLSVRILALDAVDLYSVATVVELVPAS